jgi:hypothetical protein
MDAYHRAGNGAAAELQDLVELFEAMHRSLFRHDATPSPVPISASLMADPPPNLMENSDARA